MIEKSQRFVTIIPKEFSSSVIFFFFPFPPPRQSEANKSTSIYNWIEFDCLLIFTTKHHVVFIALIPAQPRHNISLFLPLLLLCSVFTCSLPVAVRLKLLRENPQVVLLSSSSIEKIYQMKITWGHVLYPWNVRHSSRPSIKGTSINLTAARVALKEQPQQQSFSTQSIVVVVVGSTAHCQELADLPCSQLRTGWIRWALITFSAPSMKCSKENNTLVVYSVALLPASASAAVWQAGSQSVYGTGALSKQQQHRHFSTVLVSDAITT